MTFVIFHGSFGSPETNWFSWLKKELGKLNQKVILPQFPVDDWEKVERFGEIKNKKQNLKNWLNTFKKEVYPQINNEEEIIFIAHSISPLFNLHILEKFDINLKAAIWV